MRAAGGRAGQSGPNARSDLTASAGSRAADGIDRLLNANDGAFVRHAGASVVELQQLVIDARGASNEVRELARGLRERPSSLLREPPPAGVELPR